MKFLYWFLGGITVFFIFLEIISHSTPWIKGIFAFIIIFACVWISSMMFMQQVVQKINPNFSDKLSVYISIVIGILFAFAAVFYGGSSEPHLFSEYN